MHTEPEYHHGMRCWTGLLVVTLGLCLTPVLTAQVNGVPPSVTSFGFGGHPGWQGVPPCVTCFGFGGQPGFHGIPASVTSLGPQGFTARQGSVGTVPPARSHHHQHPHKPESPVYVYPYPYYYPYAYYNGYMEDASDYEEVRAQSHAEEDPEQYRGGPTIFDRRGSGVRYPNEYADAAPVPQTPPPSEAAPAAVEAPPESPPQPATVLVFQDGHKLDVTNYAIVGSNLYDFSGGRRLKIPLSELDLAATRKANDAIGVDFTLPALPKAD